LRAMKCRHLATAWWSVIHWRRRRGSYGLGGSRRHHRLLWTNAAATWRSARRVHFCCVRFPGFFLRSDARDTRMVERDGILRGIRFHVRRIGSADARAQVAALSAHAATPSETLACRVGGRSRGWPYPRVPPATSRRTSRLLGTSFEVAMDEGFNHRASPRRSLGFRIIVMPRARPSRREVQARVSS
jgi:hypothetical protein